MIHNQTAKIQAQIAGIKDHKGLTQKQKEARITQTKLSFIGGTDSSMKVITTISNTMIGSAIIVYPILFVKDGIIGSCIIMLCVGIIQYSTCRLLIIHNKTNEMSYGQSIKRICGQKVFKFNAGVNFVLLFFVCVIYFLLVVENFYAVSVAIMQTYMDFDPPKTNTITFEKYSIQWATIIATLVCLPLYMWKSIDGLLRVFKYTIYCVIAYGIFILVLFLKNVIEGTIHFGEYKLFDPNFSNVAGAFALSFLIHPTAAPILKKNKIQQNNQRDLFFGYALTAFIYFFVGFIGGLGCAQEVQNILDNPSQYSTIFDCVASRKTAQDTAFFIIGKIIQFGILIQNISLLPILNFISRKQFIDFVDKPKYKVAFFNGYNIAQLIVASIVSIFCIDVSIVLSFDGAIVGFFMAYGVPIYMHLKCYHHKLTKQQWQKKQSLLSSNQQILINQSAKQQGLDIQYTVQLEEKNFQQIQQMMRCNPHPPKNKPRHYIIYGSMLIIGIALGIFKIYSFFE